MNLIDTIMDALGFEPKHQGFDVAEAVHEKAKERGMADLNYSESIVDLLKVLGLPHDHAYRDQLAAELQYQGDPNNSAEMNSKLHELVMLELAKRGGEVPDDWK
jgi:hypothetical protein